MKHHLAALLAPLFTHMPAFPRIWGMTIYYHWQRLGGFPEVRRWYFGEITMTPVNGVGRFNPPKFNFIAGGYWKYPDPSHKKAEADADRAVTT